MGLTALLLLQHARAAARFDIDGHVVLREDQDRTQWDAATIAEGLPMLDKGGAPPSAGTDQVQAAIAALHARAVRPKDTDWGEIELGDVGPRRAGSSLRQSQQGAAELTTPASPSNPVPDPIA
jgi:predicted RNA polymerase sigma factor